MKIKQFADSQGISIDRMNRAAIWALEQTGREKPKRGGRYGGVDLTIEEQALCLQYLADHRKGKEKTPAPMRYEMARLGWLQTWIAALQDVMDEQQMLSVLAVIGGLDLARDRSWLDAPCLGARNGDLMVELAQEAFVDFGSTETNHGTWIGFTRYLLDQGFESPGWGIL